MPFILAVLFGVIVKNPYDAMGAYLALEFIAKIMELWRKVRYFRLEDECTQ